MNWQKPVFVREEDAIKVPTTENVEKLIAYAGPKYSTIISVFKDTGQDPANIGIACAFLIYHAAWLGVRCIAR